jgi:lipid A ethanolaminephosphotransferase
MKEITQTRLIIFTALFFVLFDNVSFFTNVTAVYPFITTNIGFLISLAVILVAFIILLFSMFSSKYTTKPILISTLLVSSITSYFMNSYYVIIDDSMIRNTFQTNLSESSDLFTMTLLYYLIFLGILPSWFVYKAKILYRPFTKEIVSKIIAIVLSIVIIVIMLFSFSKFYTSFFREHKPLRYYTNPTYWIYSIGNYINKTFSTGTIIVQQIGLDATITQDSSDKKKLVIMVVGETARADRFSLNGYEKDTNPLLEKENVVNFPNMYSCGTSTADSVPCMFSKFDRVDFDYKKGIAYENVLDVLEHTKKVDIVWRDNNSNSKGVAQRIGEVSFRTSENNTVCDVECRDIGMIVGLDKYVAEHKDKNILIVLHHMGNHGPAYYKRYTKEFEKFTPVCKTNQVEKCTVEEISNAYDNAILYTDFFLSRVINFLKPYSKDHETAMIYMSDHGESLGENGIYLHGMPYFMAPEEQKHIPSIMWFGKNDTINVEKLKSYSNNEYSHDNLFDTLLGFFDVKTKVYNKDKDILYNAK